MDENINFTKVYKNLTLIGAIGIFILLVLNILILFCQKSDKDSAILMDTGIQGIDSTMIQVSKMSSQLQELLNIMNHNWQKISEQFRIKRN